MLKPLSDSTRPLSARSPEEDKVEALDAGAASFRDSRLHAIVAIGSRTAQESHLQRRTRIAALLLAAGVAAGGGLAWWRWPVRVETAPSTRGPAIEAIYATGVVEPAVMVPVAPRSGGRLVSLDADEGDPVRRGQVLARIESTDLDQTVQEMMARERLARIQYERTRSLVEQKFVSPAELDRTRTDLEAAQAA